MADVTGDRVELTDLDVIARYSLAVRAATADRAELIAALRSDLAWLENGRRSAAPRRAAPGTDKTTATKKTTVTKKATARKATTRRR